MKKNIFNAVVCVLVLATFICAFAVMANAEVSSGPIYISTCSVDFTPTVGSTTKIPAYSREATVFLKEGHFETGSDGNFVEDLLPGDSYKLFTPASYAIQQASDETEKYLYVPALYAVNGDDGYKAVGRQLEESGLQYSYDSSTKTMTISGKIKKTGGKDVPWIIPKPGVDPETENVAWKGDYEIKTVIIEEDTGVTRLCNHCMNNMCRVETVVVPTTLNFTDCESLGRMTYLKTVKVQGSELDTGIDLRTITKKFDPQTLHTSCIQYDTDFYIGDFLAGKKNTYKADGTLDTRIIQNILNPGTARTFTVYSPSGEPCDFARDLEMARGTWKLVDGVYSDAGDGKSPKATVSIRPYSVCGVKALGYRVRTESYNGLRAEFALVNAEAKIYKVVDAGTILKTPSETPISGNSGTRVECGVIVANAELAGQMKLTKSGDEYVTGNDKVKKLVADDSHISKDGKFFVTVTKFADKAKMETKIRYVGYEIYDDGTVVYAIPLEPVSIYDTTIGLFSKGLINSGDKPDGTLWGVLDNFKEKPFDDSKVSTLNSDIATKSTKEAITSEFTCVGGELVDTTGAVVSIFEVDDKYVAIIHGADTYNGMTAVDSSWNRYNILNEEFTGIALDTIIFDSDVKSLGQKAIMGLKEVKTVIYPEGIKLGSQTFNKSNSVSTVIPCGKYTLADWTSEAVAGLADLSRADVTNVGMSNVFDGAKFIDKIIYKDVMNDTLKKFTTSYLSSTGSSTANKYVISITHGDVPLEANVADIRGTGMYVEFTLSDGTASEGLYHDINNAWGGALASVGAKTIYQDEPDGKTYKYTYSKYDTTMTAGNRNAYTREEITTK